MDYITHYQTDLKTFDYLEDLSPSQREDERRRFETLARLGGFRRGQRVLDIGSGSGWLAGLMGQRGVIVYGLDLSPEQWREDKGDFVVGDALNLPFKGCSLDGVLLSEVLEHLSDPERALQDAYRALGHGGKVLASVPYREKIRFTLCVHCNRTTPVNAHLHSFDEARLTGLFKEAGFNVRGVVKFMPKVLPLLRLNRLFSFLPFPFWRVLERICPSGRKFLLCLGEKEL